MFTRPEHAKEIFAGDPEVFHAGKGNAILGPIMGEHSLLLQDSGEHKRARKLLMPAFNGHALRGYQSLVTDLARAEVDRWTPGTEFRSLDRMNALTLEVILRVVFGVTDESRLAELRPRVNATVDVSPAVLLGWGYPWLQRFGVWKRTVENQYELDRLMYAEIRERRDAPDLAERTDVLSRLILVGSGDGRPARRHRAPRPAGHPAARRPRDHGDRAVLGALRGGPRPRAPAALPAGGRRGRRRVPRRGDEGVDAAAPGDPDGGAHADEAGHDRRHRHPRRRHGRAVDRHRATRRPTTMPTRGRSGPSGSSARTRPPTPGSRSAAASVAASAPASR